MNGQTFDGEASFEMDEEPTARPSCDCGKPGQWWGDTQGLRVFACAECAAADPSLPYEFKPWRIEENPPPITGYDISKTVCIAVGDSGLALFGGKARAEAERAIACVNACAGMADPAAEIAALHEALTASNRALMEAAGLLDRLGRQPVPNVLTIREAASLIRSAMPHLAKGEAK